MGFPNQPTGTFTDAGVVALPAGLNGVYGIYKGGETRYLYIGRAEDIRRRLTEHLAQNVCVKRYGATHFTHYVTRNAVAEEKALIEHWNPPCNERVG